MSYKTIPQQNVPPQVDLKESMISSAASVPQSSASVLNSANDEKITVRVADATLPEAKTPMPQHYSSVTKGTQIERPSELTHKESTESVVSISMIEQNKIDEVRYERPAAEIQDAKIDSIAFVIKKTNVSDTQDVQYRDSTNVFGNIGGYEFQIGKVNPDDVDGTALRSFVTTPVQQNAVIGKSFLSQTQFAPMSGAFENAKGVGTSTGGASPISSVTVGTATAASIAITTAAAGGSASGSELFGASTPVIPSPGILSGNTSGTASSTGVLSSVGSSSPDAPSSLPVAPVVQLPSQPVFVPVAFVYQPVQSSTPVVVNNAPVAVAGVNAATEDAGAVTGSLLASDADVADTLTYTVVTNGTYGAFVVTNAASGAYSYTINNALNAVQALAQGQTVIDTLTFRVTDNSGANSNANIVVTITGVNDAPVAVAGVKSVNEDGVVVAGTLLSNDVDTSDTHTYSVVTNGTYGTFLVTDAASGAYTYAINNALGVVQALAQGQTLTDTLTFRVADSSAESSNANIVVTITGVNDAPVAIAGVNAVNEDGAVITGTLTSTDVDTSDTHTYSVITDGTYGTFLVTDAASGAYSYTINNANGAVQALAQGQTLVDTLTFRVTDNNSANSNANIVVTITGVNDAATIANLGGDTFTYTENDAATVIDQGTAASITDVDNSNFNGGSLTVSVASGGAASEDVLAIRNQGSGAGQIGVSGANVTYAGTIIGTYTGGSSGNNLVVSLNSNASTAATAALLANITYFNNSDAPSTSDRTVRFVLNDGLANSSNYDATIHVSAVNDAPVLSGLSGSVTLGENTVNAAPQIIDSSVTFTDPDANLNGGSLTVSYSAGGSSQDYLTIQNQGSGAGQIGVSGSTVSYEGNAFATITSSGSAGTSLILSFDNANATQAAVDALIQAITYQNTSDNPTSTRTLSVVVNDGVTNSSAQTVLVTVTPEADIKTFTSGAETFITGAESDTFIVTTASHFSTSDSISAGGGNDILRFGSGGAFSFSGMSLAGLAKGGIDQIDFNATSLTGTLSIGGFNFVLNSDNQTILVNNGTMALTISPTTSSAAGTVVIGGTGQVSMTTGFLTVADGVNGNIKGASGSIVVKVTGGTGDDTVLGGTGADTVTGGAGNDSISLSSGADTVTGGAGADTLTGGTGIDKFIYTSTSESTVAAPDIITDFNTGSGVYSAGELDQINFTPVGTYVFDLNNQGTFTGTANQFIAVQSGANTLIRLDTNGDSSSDMDIQLNNYTSTNFLAYRDLTVSTLSVIGTAGADVLTFNNSLGGNILATLGAGADIVTAQVSAGTLYGGTENDTFIISSALAYTVYGEGDNDLFSITAGAAHVASGGDGADVFAISNTGGGTISGNAGNDTFTVSSSSTSTIYGGTENDTFTISNGTQNVYGENDNDVFSITGGSNHNVLGGAGADVFTVSGTTTVAVVMGDAGNDTFTVSSNGSNTIYGGTESDTITVSAGSHTVYGDNDNDVISITGGTTQIAQGGAGADIMSVLNTATTTVSLYGNAGNDTITGSRAANYIDGGDDNDTLIGGYDGDTILGGAGDDVIYADNLQYSNSTVSGLRAWFDASDANSNGTTASGDIATWSDKSAGGTFDATAASAATVTYDAGLGGRAALNFNYAQSDYYTLSNSIFAAGNNGYTIFAVFKESFNNSTSTHGLFFTGTAALNQAERFTTYQQQSLFDSWYGNDVAIFDTNPYNTSSGYIGSAMYTAGVGRSLTLNGGTPTTGSDTSFNLVQNVSYIGYSTGTEYFSGNIAELVIFNTNLSTADRQVIDEYLSYKYGIAISGLFFNTDTLTGGTGADTFTWTNASYSSGTEAFRDVITDFNFSSGSYSAAEGDKIDISGLVSTPFNLVGLDNFAGLTNQVIWAQSGANTIVSIDYGGDNQADWSIQLTGFTASNLSANDFIWGSNSSVTTNGTAGADVITGDATKINIIDGGSGGNDTITGGASADYIKVTAGDNTITANGGNDVIKVGSGNDTVYAGAGKDAIHASENNNPGATKYLVGGDGDDTFHFVYGQNTQANIWGDSDTTGWSGASNTIHLQGAVFLGGDWNVMSGTGYIIFDNTLQFNSNASGTVTMNDGSNINFNDIQIIQFDG